jgi:uncharacterized protein YdcH (DUF465 family)
MSKSNSALAVVEPTRLESARAAFDALQARRAEIDEQIAAVEAGAAPSAAATGAAQSLRQQKTRLFARMLRSGAKVDAASPDVMAIDRKLIDAEQSERQAVAVVAARGEVVADLQAQVRALNEQSQAVHRELLQAQFEAAAHEIHTGLIPAVRVAAAALGVAMARLCGAGVAHNQLARELREKHGLNVQALGTEWPQRQIILNPIAFGISDNGQFNSLAIDLGTQIDEAAADALNRWRR